ncbi:MAG: DNA polymerase III subunit gamma/tau, partial [Deltaproteobacteria bacterium]|nr:DNA polymerase III subunit gamma/tau [Deltaproteobacteria bacterium]
MAYLALARKYRPQVFEDIIGQEHVTRTLRNAIESDRVHHAYLFTGIRGVGKTTAARVLAKALNCEKGPTVTPCNACPACTEITRGNAMDVLEIDGASNRGIDDVRELRETVRYTTARERFRIVIIDEVHMLTEAAFNALLKTLEEPPAHVRFILATTDPQKVPATILSRCQRFDFHRVETGVLVAHLARLCAAEGAQVEEDALRIVVREAGGSVRDALSLLDQLLAAAEGPLTTTLVGEILGVADRAWISGLLEAVFHADTPRGLRTLRDVYMTGYDLRTFLLELLQSVRDMVVLALTGDEALVDRSREEIAALRSLSAGHGAQDLDEYFRVLLEGTDQLRRSEHPALVAEEVVIRLCNLRRSVDVSELVGRLEALEKRLREGS